MRAWLQASRPLALANLVPPLVFGQAVAYSLERRFDAAVACALGLWAILDLCCIVWTNDYADREHDRGGNHKTPFSGGSGVIPEGRIDPPALRNAALIASGMLFALGVALGIWRGPWVFALTATALFVSWAYSCPPLSLSHRGGGIHAQALGVGVVLPLLGYAAQAGNAESFPWAVLGVTYALGAAGHVATSLPDESADRRARKRTWAVRLGALRARWMSLALTVCALWGVLLLGAPLVATAAVIPLVFTLRLGRSRNAHIQFILLQGAAAQIALWGWSLFLVVRHP